MIESLSFEKWTFLGFTNLKLWVEDGELHFSRDVMDCPDENTKDKVSTMSVEEFSKKLDAIGITKWKKEYAPEELFLDGVSWKVVYEDADYKKYKSSGENEYPPNWKKFLKLLKDAVGEFEA